MATRDLKSYIDSLREPQGTSIRQESLSSRYGIKGQFQSQSHLYSIQDQMNALARERKRIEEENRRRMEERKALMPDLSPQDPRRPKPQDIDSSSPNFFVRLGESSKSVGYSFAATLVGMLENLLVETETQKRSREKSDKLSEKYRPPMPPGMPEDAHIPLGGTPMYQDILSEQGKENLSQLRESLEGKANLAEQGRLTNVIANVASLVPKLATRKIPGVGLAVFANDTFVNSIRRTEKRMEETDEVFSDRQVMNKAVADAAIYAIIVKAVPVFKTLGKLSPEQSTGAFKTFAKRIGQEAGVKDMLGSNALKELGKYWLGSANRVGGISILRTLAGAVVDKMTIDQDAKLWGATEEDEKEALLSMMGLVDAYVSGFITGGILALPKTAYNMRNIFQTSKALEKPVKDITMRDIVNLWTFYAKEAAKEKAEQEFYSQQQTKWANVKEGPEMLGTKSGVAINKMAAPASRTPDFIVPPPPTRFTKAIIKQKDRATGIETEEGIVLVTPEPSKFSRAFTRLQRQTEVVSSDKPIKLGTNTAEESIYVPNLTPIEYKQSIENLTQGILSNTDYISMLERKLQEGGTAEISKEDIGKEIESAKSAQKSIREMIQAYEKKRPEGTPSVLDKTVLKTEQPYTKAETKAPAVSVKEPDKSVAVIKDTAKKGGTNLSDKDAKEIRDIMLYAKTLNETLTLGEAIAVHEVYNDPSTFEGEELTPAERLQKSIDLVRDEMDLGEIEYDDIAIYGELAVGADISSVKPQEVPTKPSKSKAIPKKPVAKAPETSKPTPSKGEYEPLKKALTVEDITTTKFTYMGQPVRYDSNYKGEGRKWQGRIDVGVNFFKHSKESQQNILNHEISHDISESILKSTDNFIEAKDAKFLGQTKTTNGKTYWEGIFGDIGSNSVDETVTDLIQIYYSNPTNAKAKYPEAIKWLESKLKETEYPLAKVVDSKPTPKKPVAKVVKEEVKAPKQQRKYNITKDGLFEKAVAEANKLGEERLKKAVVMRQDDTIEEFVDRIINQTSKYEKSGKHGNIKTQATSIQMLSKPMLWGETGESLRKALLKLAKAKSSRDRGYNVIPVETPKKPVAKVESKQATVKNQVKKANKVEPKPKPKPTITSDLKGYVDDRVREIPKKERSLLPGRRDSGFVSSYNESILLEKYDYWEDLANKKYLIENTAKELKSNSPDEDGSYNHFRKLTAELGMDKDKRLWISPKFIKENTVGGVMGEHLRENSPENVKRTSKLAESFKAKGFVLDENDFAITIYVDSLGRGYIAEGNHRINAAIKAEIDIVPVLIKYWQSGPLVQNEWNPDKIVNRAHNIFLKKMSDLPAAKDTPAPKPKQEDLSIQNKAIEEFGKTTNPLEAGYILKNGVMLDFSGKKDGGPSGVRYMDHRDVAVLYKDIDGTKAMSKFMGESEAIRVSFTKDYSLIDVTGQAAITDNQRSVILSNATKSKEVRIEFYKDVYTETPTKSYSLDVPLSKDIINIFNEINVLQEELAYAPKMNVVEKPKPKPKREVSPAEKSANSNTIPSTIVGKAKYTPLKVYDEYNKIGVKTANKIISLTKENGIIDSEGFLVSPYHFIRKDLFTKKAIEKFEGLKKNTAFKSSVLKDLINLEYNSTKVEPDFVIPGSVVIGAKSKNNFVVASDKEKKQIGLFNKSYFDELSSVSKSIHFGPPTTSMGVNHYNIMGKDENGEPTGIVLGVRMTEDQHSDMYAEVFGPTKKELYQKDKDAESEVSKVVGEQGKKKTRESQKLGILPGSMAENLNMNKDARTNIPDAMNYKGTGLPNVDKEINDSSDTSIFTNKKDLKEKISDIIKFVQKNTMRGSLPELDWGEYQDLRFALNTHRQIMPISGRLAMQLVSSIYGDLPSEYKTLVRDYIVLTDMHLDIYVYKVLDPNNLRFGFKDLQEFDAAYQKVSAIVYDPKDTTALKVIEKRKEVLSSIIKDYSTKGKETLDVNFAPFFNRGENYLRNIVIEYYMDNLTPYNKASKTFKRRHGTSKNILTSVEMADFISFMALYRDMSKMDVIKAIRQKSLPLKFDNNGELIVPPGYSTVSAIDLKFSFPDDFFFKHDLKVQEQMLLSMGHKKGSETYKKKMRETIQEGKQRGLYIVEDKVRKTLDNEIITRKHANEIEKIASRVTSIFKYLHIKAPWTAVPYQLSNMLRDLDQNFIHLSGAKFFGKAIKAVFDAVYHHRIEDPDMFDYIKMGGLYGHLTFQTMQTSGQFKEIDVYTSKGNTKSALQLAKEIKKIYGLDNFFTFRENILRFMQYKSFLEQLKKKGGADAKLDYYYGTVRRYNEGLSDIKKRAYDLSNTTNQDYNDVPPWVQYMSDAMVPFIKGSYANFIHKFRAVANVFMHDPEYVERLGTQYAKKWQIYGRLTPLSLMLLGKALASLMAFSFAQHLWNRIIMRDADDKLPDYAKKMSHITLGELDGRTIWRHNTSSFRDVMSSLGFPDFYEDIRRISRGEFTLKEWAENLATNSKQTLTNLNPVIKMLEQPLQGFSTFPDTSQIRDTRLHIARAFRLEHLYRYVAGLPQYKGKLDLVNIPFGTVMDGEADYWAIYGLIDDFYDRHGIHAGKPGMSTDEKAMSLYYLRQAVRLEDRDAALKYLDRYFISGGTGLGLRTSIRNLDPRTRIPRGERVRFYSELTPEEEERLNRGIEFYERMVEDYHAIIDEYQD